MNSSILTAIESLCDDIATNTNADDNKKRAEAIVFLALAGAFTSSEYENKLEDDHESAASATNAVLPKPGDRFTYNGIKFIALGEEQGGILAVMADTLEDEMPFDKNNCNDWRKSTLRKYLNEEFIKNLNRGDLLPFISDLTTDSGQKDYGTSEDYIALLSCDLYRKYREYVPKYDIWVWTLTPWHIFSSSAYYARIVNTDGSLSYICAYYGHGVAPACIFNPTFFE